MEMPVSRNLGDGDYRPDWRNVVVTDYLKIAVTSDPKVSCAALLANEKDVVVRQVVRYHLEDSCVCKKAVRFALAIQQNNSATGTASTIRAMILADCTCDQIAEYFKADRQSVVVFTRLFFDVERYLANEYWLESLVRRVSGTTPVELREKRLLRIAFHKGWQGLRLELSPRSGRTPQDVKALQTEVNHAVTARALEYIQNLQDEGLAPSQDDFHRYTLLSQANARASGAEPEAKEESLQQKFYTWVQAVAEDGLIPESVIDNVNASLDEEEGVGEASGRRAPVAQGYRLPRPKRVDSQDRPSSGQHYYRDRATGEILPIEAKDVECSHLGSGQTNTGE